MTIRRVLLATDGSDHSLRAAEHIQSMMGTLGIEVTLLYVRQPAPLHAVGEGVAFVGAQAPLAPEQVLGMTQNALHLEEHQVKRIVAEGNPVEEIIRVAREGHHDLIVVGTRGQEAWKRHRVGSVSLSLVEQAPCTVMVVK